MNLKYLRLVEQRPAVKQFSGAMELKLLRKDYKGGWNPDQCTEELLWTSLVAEMEEYIKSNSPEELVDIANFAMMLWNRQNKTEEYK